MKSAWVLGPGAYSGFEVRGREMWSERSSAAGTRMEAPTEVGSGEKNLACSPSKWCILMHSGARLGQL